MVLRDIIAACARSNTKLARELLDQGADPNSVHAFDASTPLLEAVRASSLPLVQLLLDAGANVNATDRDGWSALMLSTLAKDSVEIAAALLASCGGVNVNQTRKNRETALTLAVSQGSEELVRLLVSNGAKPTGNMPDGRPLKLYLDLMAGDRRHGRMVSQIQGGRRESNELGVSVIEYKDTWPHGKIVAAPDPMAALERLMSAEPEFQDLVSWDKFGPMHTLAMAANAANEPRAAALVPLMVSAGADVNQRDGKGETALLVASQKELLDLGEALVNYGASMKIQYGPKQASLAHIMVTQHKIQSLDLLCELGADLAAADATGRTALHYAAVESDPELCLVLLNQKAEPNSVDYEFLTPLHLAALHGRDESCKSLLEEGADTEAEEAQGLTPLLSASHAGQDRCVEVLLKWGANVQHRDNRLKSALHWAVLRAVASTVSTRVIRLLIHAGAEVDATDCLLMSPLTALINELGDHGLKKAHHPGRTTQILDAAEVLLENGAVPDLIHEVMTKTRMKSPCGAFIELLVKHGADPNAEDGVNRTPLGRSLSLLSDPSVRESEAALKDLGKLCGHLLDAGSNLQAFSEVITAAKGDPISERFFGMLMSHGANLNAHDTVGSNTNYSEHGWTAIQEVVRSMCQGDMDIDDGKRMIEWMIAKGADIGLSDATPAGDKIIHLLVRRMRSIGRHDTATIFRFLSKLKGSPLDVPNKQGLTPLQLAISTDDDQMVKALLERHSDPNQLHWLLQAHTQDLVTHSQLMKYAEISIANGASVDEVDADGDTVFLKATLSVLNNQCSSGEGMQFMQLLVKEGSDTTQHDANGRNALHLTAMEGNTSLTNRIQTAKFLNSSAGVSVNSKVAGRAGMLGAGKSTLHIACSAQGMTGSALAGQEVELVRFLLEAGGDPNMQDEQGNTAFNIIVEQMTGYDGKLSGERQKVLNRLATELVEHGAFTDGDPAGLEKAFDASQLYLTELMLRNGTNLKTPVHGRPLMHNIISEVATKSPSSARFEFLIGLMNLILESGADPNVLHHIVAECQASADGYELLKSCIDHGADLEHEHPGFQNRTVLQQTVEAMLCTKMIQHTKGVALIKWLLHTGASVNHQSGDDLSTVLHVLAGHNAEGLARLVLDSTDQAVNVNLISAEGLTPLGLACKEGSEEVAALLLYRYSANPDIFGGVAVPPIISAAKEGHSTIVRLLAGNGADLNVEASIAPGGRSTSLLPILLRSNQVDTELIGYLIADLGADVTLRDSFGRSSMHYAIAKALPSVVKLILEHGGSIGGTINRLDVENCTLLHFCLSAYVDQVQENMGFKEDLARRLDLLVSSGSIQAATARYMRAPQSLEESKDEMRRKEKQSFFEKTIRQLLEHGADVNAGKSLLPLAVKLDSCETLQRLLLRGTRVENVCEPETQKNLVAWLLEECVREMPEKLSDKDKTDDDDDDDDDDELPVALFEFRREKAERLRIMAIMLIEKLQTPPPELMLLAVLMIEVDGVIEALLAAGCSPSGPHGTSITPLHLVLKELVQIEPRDGPTAGVLEARALRLIQAGAEVDRGDSLLFLALECEKPSLIDALIAHNVPLNQRQNGVSPVAYAFEQGSVDMTRLLLEAGASPAFKTASGQSPLYVAYKAQNQDMVQVLTGFMDLGEEGHAIFRAIIEEVATNPTSDRLKALKQMAGGFIRRGASPNVLHEVLQSTAAAGPGLSFCEFLLSAENGADPNFRHPDTNETALAMLIKLVVRDQVSKADGCEGIDMLLTQGADANLVDCDGVTPLCIAAVGGSHQIVELLQVKGAAVDLQNPDGETALLMAVQHGHRNVVATLSKRRANPNLRGGSLVPNMGPLHEACARKDTALVRELLMNRLLEVNAKGFWGCTALHLCVGGASGTEPIEEVHVDMVEVLLGHRQIDVNIGDMDGNTVLHRAEALGCSSVCNLVRDMPHLDESRRNTKGLTAAELGRLSRSGMSGSCTLSYSAAALERGVPGAFAGLEEDGGMQGIRETDTAVVPELTMQHWGWPLFLAAYYGNVEEVGRVLEHAALANRADADGNTLLHWCAIWGESHHVEVAKALLDAGANPFSMDTMGRTAMHWAALTGNSNMVGALEAAVNDAGGSGADAYSATQDNAGDTPEHLAKQTTDFDDKSPREKISEAGTLFVRDLSFPPSLVSLATDRTSPPMRFMSTQWLLPDQMTDDLAGCGGALFETLGAEMDKATVESLPHNGVCVRCKFRGVMTEVFLDPYIPCIQGRPAFGCSRSQVQTMYIQKAYAKLAGSYQFLLTSDWSEHNKNSPLAYKVPLGAVDGHPLARMAISHALRTAEALYNGVPQERPGSWFGKQKTSKKKEDQEGKEEGHGAWFGKKKERAQERSGWFGRKSAPADPNLPDTDKYLTAFSSDFAGHQNEINRVGELLTRETKPPSELAAGGPAQTCLIGQQPSLVIRTKEPCYVKVIMNQPGGNHSIFVNVYKEGDGQWVQQSSGFARQTLEGYTLELHLDASDAGYRVVPASTLDNFSSQFSMQVQSTAELEVVNQF